MTTEQFKSFESEILADLKAGRTKDALVRIDLAKLELLVEIRDLNKEMLRNTPTLNPEHR